jgi:hypothetical protein
MLGAMSAGFGRCSYTHSAKRFREVLQPVRPVDDPCCPACRKWVLEDRPANVALTTSDCCSHTAHTCLSLDKKCMGIDLTGLLTWTEWYDAGCD